MAAQAGMCCTAATALAPTSFERRQAPLPQGTEKTYSENLTLTLSREFFDGRFRAAMVANIPTRILPRINHQSIYTPEFRYLKQEGDYSNRSWLLMVNLSYSISKGTSKYKTIDVNIEAEK